MMGDATDYKRSTRSPMWIFGHMGILCVSAAAPRPAAKIGSPSTWVGGGLIVGLVQLRCLWRSSGGDVEAGGAVYAAMRVPPAGGRALHAPHPPQEVTPTGSPPHNPA